MSFVGALAPYFSTAAAPPITTSTSGFVRRASTRRRKPAVFFGVIEGLGPSESIEGGDLPLLASKIRAAQAISAEISQRPDLPIDDDAWIR